MRPKFGILFKQCSYECEFLCRYHPVYNHRTWFLLFFTRLLQYVNRSHLFADHWMENAKRSRWSKYDIFASLQGAQLSVATIAQPAAVASPAILRKCISEFNKILRVCYFVSCKQCLPVWPCSKQKNKFCRQPVHFKQFATFGKGT